MEKRKRPFIKTVEPYLWLAREFDSSKEEKQRISLTGLIYFGSCTNLVGFDISCISPAA